MKDTKSFKDSEKLVNDMFDESVASLNLFIDNEEKKEVAITLDEYLEIQQRLTCL